MPFLRAPVLVRIPPSFNPLMALLIAVTLTFIFFASSATTVYDLSALCEVCDIECNITVHELLQLSGEKVYELCQKRKGLFKEIVTVLYTKQKFLSDFTSDMPLNSYIESICENYSYDPAHLANITIEELNLSVRSFNCLKRAGIYTVGDLTARTLDDMYKVRNLGRNSLDEITEKLKTLGLTFREYDE